ncbi:MAG: formimidoylglutamase [Bacteroidia bacterium]
MNKNIWWLTGIPDDVAVANTGGRQGAKEGPARFREMFARLKGPHGVMEQFHDGGDAECGTDIDKNHQAAAAAITKAASEGSFGVVVGGGHDHAYSHLKGIKTSMPPGAVLGCINIDPHFDLRKDKPLITSGSPFYMAIEQQLIAGENLVEFGIQKHANAPELWEYARQKQVHVAPFEEIRLGKAVAAFQTVLNELREKCDQIVLSLDMDALQAAFAPGVSAPAADGFTPSEILAMMEIAGKAEKIISLGIYELNPSFDIDNQTARLAAVAAYHFAAARINP